MAEAPTSPSMSGPEDVFYFKSLSRVPTCPRFCAPINWRPRCNHQHNKAQQKPTTRTARESAAETQGSSVHQTVFSSLNGVCVVFCVLCVPTMTNSPGGTRPGAGQEGAPPVRQGKVRRHKADGQDAHH